MHIFEFMRILVKHGGFKFTSKEDLIPIFDFGKPKFINYAKKLERDEHGQIKYERISIEEFEQIITKKQSGIPFSFREAAFIQKEKKSKNKQESADANSRLKKNFLDPNELMEKVAIIDSEQVGCILYVIDKNGLPKGTRILYAGVTHPDNANLLYHYCGYITTNENKIPVDNSLESGGFGRFINATPPPEILKKYQGKSEVFDPKQVAEENVTLGTLDFISQATGEKRELSGYALTRDVGYGEALLAHWGKGYMEMHYGFMPFEMQIFNKKGEIIDPALYEVPVEIFEHTGYHLLSKLKEDADKKRSFQLMYPLDSTGTNYEKAYLLEPDEIEEYLQYFSQERKLLAALQKDILHKSDWEPLMQSPYTQSKCKIKDYLSNNTIIRSEFCKEEIKNPLTPDGKLIFVLDYLEQVGLRAYNSKDYLAAIKIFSWLIIQAFRRTSLDTEIASKEFSPMNEARLNNWYWNLGNAYRLSEKDDEAILFLTKAVHSAPEFAKQKYKDRLELVIKEQAQKKSKQPETEAIAFNQP